MAELSFTFKLDDEMSSPLKALTESLRAATVCLEDMDEELGGINGKNLTALKNAVAAAEKEFVGLDEKAAKAKKTLSSVEEVSKKLEKVGNAAKSVGSALSTVGKAGSVVTGALTAMTTAAANTSMNFIKLYESSSVVFEKMLGGKEAADDMYASLLKIAKASTFSQEAFLNAGKSLVGVGVSAENTEKYMQAISDAVTAFGGNSENLQNTANAFKKIATNGRLSMEEMNMLSDNGIQALKILGNQYGKTTSEMREFISTGAVDAEEALAKLTEGIEQGTDGVNGYTAAMEGMAAALKGKTLTGALDSMNSAIRSFSLSLVGMNPTLKSTDEGYAENQQRIKQLTAALTQINKIIPLTANIFRGVTDSISNLLNKLVGANVVFNEATGEWENVEGILGRLRSALENTDPEKLRKIGDILLKVGIAGPSLLAVGKTLNAVGGALDSLSKKKEILSKIVEMFNKPSKEGSNSGLFSNMFTGVKNFGIDLQNAGESAAQGVGTAFSKISQIIQKTPIDLTPIKDKVTGSFSTIASTIQSRSSAVVSSIGSFTSSIGAKLSPLVQTITSKLGPVPNIVSGIGSNIATLTTSFLSAVPGLGLVAVGIGAVVGALGLLNKDGQLASGITNFFNNIAEQAPVMMQQASLLIQKFSQSVIDNLPTLVTRGVEVINAIVTGIAKSLPVLIQNGALLLVHLIEGLTSMLPALIRGGLDAVTGIITGIASALPLLVESGANAISNILEGLNESLPVIISAGIDAVTALIDGITQNLPIIIQAGVDMISKIATALSDNLPTIIEQGIYLVANLLSGIIDALPTLVTGAIEIITSIATTIWENLPAIISAGWSIVTAIAGAIWEHGPEILSAIGSAIGQIWQALINAVPTVLEKAKDIGINIVEGVKQGFSNMWEGAKNFVVDAFSGMVDGVKSFLGIHSPSTVFADQVGGQIAAGVNKGIDDKIPQAVQTLNSALAELEAEASARTGELINSITGQYGQLAGMLENQVISMVEILNTMWANLASTNLKIINQFSNAMLMVIRALAVNVVAAWQQMNANVNAVIVQMTSQTTSNIQTMIKKIMAIMNKAPAQFRAIGVQMMRDLNAGLASQMGAVQNTASEIVQLLKKTFEEGLGIHSPSRWGKWVGENTDKGLLIGLSKDKGKVIQLTEGIVGDMKGSFENGKFNAAETVQFLGDKTLDLIGYLTGVDMSDISTSTFTYPVQGQPFHENAPFHEWRGTRYHQGIDLMAPMYNPILSVLPGTVTYSGGAGGTGYGNHVIVDHGNGYESVYAHFASNSVNVGDTVSAGQQLGLADSTGNSTGSHLHFEWWNQSTGIEEDPTAFLQGAAVTVGNPLVNAIQQAYNAWKGIGVIQGSIPYDATQGVSQWSSTVQQALQMVGQPVSYMNDVLWAILNESGGDPNITNTWDSNWYAGTPSTGLMQVIQPTFDAYRDPSLINNINDPLANIVASLRYMLGRYGSLEAVFGPRRSKWYGYATGTSNARRGWALVGEEGPELVNFRGGEVVKNNADTNAILNSISNMNSPSNLSNLVQQTEQSPALNFTITVADTNGVDYRAMSTGIAANSVNNGMGGGSAPNITIEVNNNINNSGDLDNAETRIYNVIVDALKTEYETTGGYSYGS